MAADPAAGTSAATALLGRLDDPRFAGRTIETVDVGWGDARKHRQILRTACDRELALRLPRGSFLADGSVLDDDGSTVVAVRRPPEDAIVVPLHLPPDPETMRRALLLGHRLGNRHAPIELTTTELRTPLTTSAPAAERMLAELGLPGVVRRVPLAAHGWSSTSADHRQGHTHA